MPLVSLVDIKNYPHYLYRSMALTNQNMVKVVHDIALLSQLQSESKWKRQRHTVIQSTSRYALIFFVLLATGVLITNGVGEYETASRPLRNDDSSRSFKFSDSKRSWERLRREAMEGEKEIREEFLKVISDFMKTAPPESFSESAIRQHYDNDENNTKNTTILVTINSRGQVSFTSSFEESRHGRASSVEYMLRRIIEDRRRKRKRRLPKVTFSVMVNDGHRPRVATFGSARHWQSWDMMIPIPLGNIRGFHHGWGTPLQNWDDYIEAHVHSTHDDYAWKDKMTKALFRGSLGMQSYALGSCNWQNNGACRRATSWNEVNRGVLYTKSKEAPYLFDVGFTSHKTKPMQAADAFKDAPPVVQTYRFRDFQKYKYLLNVGSNQDWAERLRCLLFTNSAVVIHEAETKEFFTPLLKPWIHFIPTNLMFTDLVQHVKWAAKNDRAVQRIVQNQNRFAHRFLTERAMQIYWEIAVEQFALRQLRAKTSSVSKPSSS